MPFTLVHPAAVLPLARTPLVPSALVAGSMAPDLPYYVSLQWIGGDYNLTLTHSATSVLWLDPLIALALLALFHGLLKRPVVTLLPRSVVGRLLPILDAPVRRTAAGLAWVVVSVVIGAATHLGWDALNDAAGYGWSGRLNLLGDVVGTLALVGWAVHWWRTTAAYDVPAGRLVGPTHRAAVLAALVVLPLAWGTSQAIRVWARVSVELHDQGMWTRSAVADHAVRELAVHTALALTVVLVAWSVAWHLARATRSTSVGAWSS